jgi:hypothetical protein
MGSNIPLSNISLSSLCIANGTATAPYSASSLYATTAFNGFLSNKHAPTQGSLLSMAAFRGTTFGQQAPTPLFSFSSPFTFRPEGTGVSGPTMALFNADASYNTQPWFSNNFRLWPTAVAAGVNGYQQWTIPKTGTYTFTASGGGGGDVAQRSGLGGKGAVISSTFTLPYSNTLLLVCGQRAPDGFADAAGGGGASWVVLASPSNTLTPLLVAGGGGGAEKNTNAGDSFFVAPVGADTTNGWNQFQVGLMDNYGGFGGGRIVTSRGGPGGGYVTGSNGIGNYLYAGGGGWSFVNTAYSGYGGSYNLIGVRSNNTDGYITVTPS